MLGMCEVVKFYVDQSLEFITEIRILVGMKIENRGGKKFPWKKNRQAYFFLTACWCRQIKVRKNDILHEFKCAIFPQICLQTASDCTDISLDCQHFPRGEEGGMPPDPPWISSFFFHEQFQALVDKDTLLCLLSVWRWSEHWRGEGRGGMPPDPPWNFLLFFMSNSRL